MAEQDIQRAVEGQTVLQALQLEQRDPEAFLRFLTENITEKMLLADRPAQARLASTMWEHFDRGSNVNARRLNGETVVANPNPVIELKGKRGVWPLHGTFRLKDEPGQPGYYYYFSAANSLATAEHFLTDADLVPPGVENQPFLTPLSRVSRLGGEAESFNYNSGEWELNGEGRYTPNNPVGFWNVIRGATRTLQAKMGHKPRYLPIAHLEPKEAEGAFELASPAAADQKENPSLTYLRRKLEPRASEAARNQPRLVLYEKMQEVTYAEKGHESINKDNIRLEFSYEPTDSLDRHKLYPNLGAESLDFKKLTELVITNTESGYVLNIFELLPPEYRVYFNPSEEVEAFIRNTDPSANNAITKVIYIFGDLAIPRALVTLLHEIGHCIKADDIRASDYARSAIHSKNATTQDGAGVLSSERSANAFAFRKLHPFITQQGGVFPRNAVASLMHNSLHKYSNAIREATPKIAH